MILFVSWWKPAIDEVNNWAQNVVANIQKLIYQKNSYNKVNKRYNTFIKLRKWENGNCIYRLRLWSTFTYLAVIACLHAHCCFIVCIWSKLTTVCYLCVSLSNPIGFREVQGWWDTKKVSTYFCTEKKLIYIILQA